MQGTTATMIYTEMNRNLEAVKQGHLTTSEGIFLFVGYLTALQDAGLINQYEVNYCLLEYTQG